jgi:hypothetical protein
VDLIVRVKRDRQIPRLFLIDEDPDVLPNRILLGDDAKAKAGVALVERRKDSFKSRARDVHFGVLCCIGTEWAGDVYRHGHNSAASTE